MSDEHSLFQKRKRDHIELAMMPENQASEFNSFDAFSLIHEALPDLDFNSINIQTHRFGQAVKTPFIVSSMTAGHEDAIQINRNLMAACAETGWAMGVGSQRRELTDRKASEEWHSLRADFPQVSLFSNIGIAQLVSSSIEDIQRLTQGLEAQALIIHCNPLQECIQPEGTPLFKGCWTALEHLIKILPLPVIVKETGCGFSSSTLRRLNNIGVTAVDVSGLGGTHWGRIEGHRAPLNSPQHHAASTFRHWGIDTLTSVQHAMALHPHFEVWGSGGVRHGLDAAKLLALGATTIGFAKPMLAGALQSQESVVNTMLTIEYELKVAMFCTGSSVINDLKEKACH